jgi:hypothetical protein
MNGASGEMPRVLRVLLSSRHERTMCRANDRESAVKPSSISCAVFVASMMMVPIVIDAHAQSKSAVDGATEKPAAAPTTANPARSNADARTTGINAMRPNVFQLDPGDQVSIKACTDNGGALAKDGRNLTCTNPRSTASRQKECRTWQHPFDGLNIWMCRPCKAPTCGCDC